MYKISLKFIIFFSLTCVSYGDIIINELVSATSDRIIKYSVDGIPSIGSGISWTELQFDDSSWSSGPGGFGFGGGDDATDLSSEMIGVSVSLYIRQKIVVSASDSGRGDALRLTID